MVKYRAVPASGGERWRGVRKGGEGRRGVERGSRGVERKVETVAEVEKLPSLEEGLTGECYAAKPDKMIKTHKKI